LEQHAKDTCKGNSNDIGITTFEEFEFESTTGALTINPVNEPLVLYFVVIAVPEYQTELWDAQLIELRFDCPDASTYDEALWNNLQEGVDEHLLSLYTVGQGEEV